VTVFDEIIDVSMEFCQLHIDVFFFLPIIELFCLACIVMSQLYLGFHL
jgi:hypothetical protein